MLNYSELTEEKIAAIQKRNTLQSLCENLNEENKFLQDQLKVITLVPKTFPQSICFKIFKNVLTKKKETHFLKKIVFRSQSPLSSSSRSAQIKVKK